MIFFLIFLISLIVVFLVVIFCFAIKINRLLFLNHELKTKMELVLMEKNTSFMLPTIENFLHVLILRNIIDISDLPFDIRISNEIYYITAFRSCRDRKSDNEYIFQLLKSDIQMVQSDIEKQRLQQIYYSRI